VSRRRGAIVVFAKEPAPGRVKTRLCPPFDPAAAAQLYAALLDDVLAATARMAAETDLDAVLAVHPPEACAALARRAPTPFSVVRQRGAGLGPRMDWALREAGAAGRAPILLRGSDSPLLDAALLRSALAALERVELVLSPDGDGGYGLVGLRRPVRGLFDHPMSTPSVLDDTLERARRAGLSCELLAPGFDIDRAADLDRLAAARTPAAERLCPRTLALLDARNLWELAKSG
jgi:rSAM/selenodomain-associated transferase 1